AILEQHRAFRGVFLAQAGAGAGADEARAVSGIHRADAVPDRAVIANVPARPPPCMALAEVGASMARPSAALAATARSVDLRSMGLSSCDPLRTVKLPSRI